MSDTLSFPPGASELADNGALGDVTAPGGKDSFIRRYWIALWFGFLTIGSHHSPAGENIDPIQNHGMYM